MAVSHSLLLSNLIASTPYALDIFKTDEVVALEARVFEKRGKPYLTDWVSGAERPAKPEEIVRQLYLYRLIYTYGYSPDRITIERPVYFGSSVHDKRADIFVCEAGLPDAAYIIVETKQPRRSDGLEQLKSYCNAEGAPIAVWTNGSEELILHREDPNYYRSLTDLPRVDQTLADIINEPVTLEQLRQNDKLVREQWTLKKVILDLENLVLSHAQGDAFDEIFKLIYTKLYDEWKAERRPKHVVEFRAAGATRQQLYERINGLFQEAKNKWPGVFSPADKIELTPDQLAVCVSFLQDLALFHSNLQIIDEAFEYLVTQVAKGAKGQYFTPRHVIDMCVRMLNPSLDEYVIDTAAGSCGFTIHTFFYVWNNELDTQGPTRIQSEYASEMVYGIDLDTRSVKIAKAINLIAGDGKSNVYQANTLNPESWDSVIRAGLEPRLRRTLTDKTPESEQMSANRRDEDNRRAMRLFSFDVLLTNPPFAGDIRDKRLLQHYRLAKTWRVLNLEKLTDSGEREKYAADPRRHIFLDSGKSAEKQSRDVLFIERNLEFLRPGGRMAIILPQGRLNNITDGYVRQFLTEHCRVLAVVGLHVNTFKPHTGTKTSVLFVQKWNDDPTAGPLCPRVENYPVFFAVSQRGGKDNSGEYVHRLGLDKKPIWLHGRPIIDHDLDQIATAFVLFASENQLGFWKDPPVPPSLSRAVPDTPISPAWSAVPFVEVLKAGRLDAEFFRPAAIAAVDRIRSGGQWAYLGDLVTFCQRGVQPEYIADGPVKVVNSQHLTGTLLADELERTSLDFWEKNPGAQLQSGDALLYSTGAYIGRTNFYLRNEPAIGSNHVTIIRADPNKCNPLFLAVFLNSQLGLKQTDQHARGSAQREIYPDDLKHFLIWLPDRDIQDEIARKAKASFDAQQAARQMHLDAQQQIETLLGRNT